MSTRLQAWHYLFQARLSRRIVLWVFASFILIEGIILLPSVYRRRQESLHQLKAISNAQVAGVMQTVNPNASGRELLHQIEQATRGSIVLGGALYTMDGQLVGTFGEPPDLFFSVVRNNANADRYSSMHARYDAVWAMPPLTGRYVLIIRHQASSVQQDLMAYIARVSVLVLVIAMFVTLVTLMGLEPLLITPVLLLRRDLLRAGEAIRQDQEPPQFDSLALNRRDELGDVIAAFNVMYQQATEAIAERRQAEEKFSKAFHYSPNPLMITAQADDRLLEVNDSFLHLFGALRDEVIGRSMAELRLWAKPDRHAELRQQVQQEGLVQNQEYLFRTQSGELRSVLLSTYSLSLNGTACLAYVLNDISDRKKAEDMLARLAEIGELAAMIVHEVRNPLTTVMMGLNSFRQLELPDRAQLRLGLAIDEADRLQRLLNEILQYARCQTLHEELLDLNALLHELLEPLRALPTTQGRIVKFVPAPVSVCIMGDRDKLKQIWINVISNACEAVDEGDVITCQVEPESAEEVCVRTHNGGKPILPDELPKLTKPFYTTKPAGNGLGLAIVKQIVEAHRGELLIESTEAVGTIVTVKLPIWSAEC